jgi:ribose transport system permease protein
MNRKAQLWVLNQAPLVMFVAVLMIFGLLAEAFRQPENAMNILIQTSSMGILAVGMTFVLLTAGVDLSVGSIMFVAAALGGKLILSGWSFAAVLATMILVGGLYGALNAVFVTRLAIMAFIVTLATRFFGRGLGLRITETRAMNLPESFYELGTARILGVPMPILLFVLVVLAAHVVLTRTPFGRQIYAVGADPEAARKAGIPTRTVLFSVYLISGLCAAVASVVALSQAPAVSPSFGQGSEFMAIAAAVLGGTSLFGGRGAVFPGTVLGAVLIQTIHNGLNILNVNPYLYPLITGGIIFIAVLIDSLRNGLLERLGRRKIFVERFDGSDPTVCVDDRRSTR